jgi:hypothetical protein
MDQLHFLPASPRAARASRLLLFHAFLSNFIRVSDASPRSGVLFKGGQLLSKVLADQKISVDDAIKCAEKAEKERNPQLLLQQDSVAPALAAAIKAGAGLASVQNEGGWQAAARVLLAPPCKAHDMNFHSVMKCIDVLKAKADDCRAARDLKLTEKKICDERSFLNNELKKLEIRQGYIDKKKAAAATKDGLSSPIDIQKLEAEADKKVAEVLASKEAAINKNISTLQQKRQDVKDSAEVQLYDCVQRVWKACGAAAIHDEFQALDRFSRANDRRTRVLLFLTCASMQSHRS